MGHTKPRCLVFAFVMLCGGWRAPLMAQGQAQAYAVQIAALQSPESAESLVNGLRARELNAYWVKAHISGQGVLYRVRLGKFASISQAHAYAERLQKSGLLDQYFIVTYDPPSKVAAGVVPPVMASASTPDPSRTVSPQSTAAASPLSSAAPPSLGQAERETIILIASRQWAATAPLGDIARSSPAASPELAAAPPATKQSPSPVVKNAPAPPLSAPPVAASPNGSSSVASAPPSSSSLSSGGSSPGSSAALPQSAIGTAVSVLPPEVSPAVSRSVAAPAPSSNPSNVSSGESEKLPALQELGPPLLRGVVESRNGQLQLVVQNLDARQTFKGLAQVAVNDGQRQNDTAPVPLVLRPDEERAFPLNASLVNGTYTMMIFDDTGAIRIIRSAPIGAGLPQSKTAGTTTSPPPLPDNDISVVPRQIAATSENITLEFEITSQRPLGYITLTLHVGNTPFPQRAVLTGNQGRIPFLIPTRLPETAFTYELKDESERVLLTGEDDLRRLVK